MLRARRSVTQVAGIMKQRRRRLGSGRRVGTSRLVGIVTDRDLVVKVLAEGSEPEQATVRTP